MILGLPRPGAGSLVVTLGVDRYLRQRQLARLQHFCLILRDRLLCSSLP